jgi:hypothetical protein
MLHLDFLPAKPGTCLSTRKNRLQLVKSLRQKERKVCNTHLVFIEIIGTLLINAYILIFLKYYIKCYFDCWISDASLAST